MSTRASYPRERRRKKVTMVSVRCFCMILMLLNLALLTTCGKDDFFHCKDNVNKWEDSSSKVGMKKDSVSLKDLLFFLHVPRTGGRVYSQCFLRKLYTSLLECPRSYDKLHFDPSKPSCKLVATHDDYSLMSKLPEGMTSVVTIIRDPVERVFSTYEFSMEVAARFLSNSNLMAALKVSNRTSGSTLSIWPWKYLVPWMRKDLFERKFAREVRDFKEIEVSSNPHDIKRGSREIGKKVADDSVNPYDIEDLLMPLHVYIEDPMAHDLVHNGATFQVAGLTNNSYLSKSHELRWCVRKFPKLGEVVLDFAKSRLDRMLYVGLTEKHRKSAMIFANLVGSKVLSQMEYWGAQAKQSVFSPDGSSFILDDALEDPSGVQNTTERKRAIEVPSAANHEVGSAANHERRNQNMTVESLLKDYENCASSLRKSHSSRSKQSFKKIPAANFSKEARSLVSKNVIERIRLLNSLDVELHKYAQKIFLRQEEHLMQSSVARAQSQRDPSAEVEQCAYWCSSWWEAWLGPTSALVFVFVVFVVVAAARRRTSKLKL